MWLLLDNETARGFRELLKERLNVMAAASSCIEEQCIADRTIETIDDTFLHREPFQPAGTTSSVRLHERIADV